jgi:D-alanyl-D-alanine carboxypeptidase/D-alanyl-D-alanine-endopeptidase (penicillin-binding protein 4)
MRSAESAYSALDLESLTPHDAPMRRTLVPLLIGALVVAGASPAWGRARWMREIDRLVRGRSIGVSVHEAGDVLYRWDAKQKRTPASVEKLLLSMALLNEVPDTLRIATSAATTGAARGPVVLGNVYILGRGDPSITGGGRFGKNLPFEPTRLALLARRIRDAGIKRIEGAIVGSTGYFAHDWWAPGWRPYFPAQEVALPSALTFEGNVRNDRHTDRPEYWAARSLTRRLEAIGVRVTRRPDAGPSPGRLDRIAQVRSRPLPELLRYTNRQSSNFFAEVLGKRLAVERTGLVGTIARAARSIERFAASNHVSLAAHDSSGLSYHNRVSPQGLTRLLAAVERKPYGALLRSTLPGAGQGTLAHRLNSVRVRAKTGTLSGISALSGWVWLRRRSTWAEFAILSRGMPKTTAASIEDRVVRIISRSAR